MKQTALNFKRLISLAFKSEWHKVLRDKGVMLIMVGAMIIYPIVYSIAYQNNVLRDIKIVVVDSDHSPISRQAIRMLDASSKIKIAFQTNNIVEAFDLFDRGDAKGVIVLEKGFEKSLYIGDRAKVALYCDGASFLQYKETLSGVLKTFGTLSAGVEVKRLMAKGSRQEQSIVSRDPIPATFTLLYNPQGGYGLYVMPALILIIMQQTLLIGIGMLGGAQREKGHVKGPLAIVKSWSGISSILLGKGLVYFMLTLFNILFSIVMVHSWYGYPDKGSMVDVFAILVPFVLATIFMGLFIAQFFKHREHSIIFLVFLSPIVLFLSGVSWPDQFLPLFPRIFSTIFPSTIAAQPYLRIRTMGVDISHVTNAILILWGQALLYFLLAILTIRHYRSKN